MCTNILFNGITSETFFEKRMVHTNPLKLEVDDLKSCATTATLGNNRIVILGREEILKRRIAPDKIQNL